MYRQLDNNIFQTLHLEIKQLYYFKKRETGVALQIYKDIGGIQND